MNERVVEILVYIMNEMQGEKAAPNHMELISRDLLQRGYSENEIKLGVLVALRAPPK